MQKTAIEWSDLSSNPLRYRDATGRDVWACEKVSAGCRGCYAEALALRFDKGKAFNAGNMAGLTPYLSDAEVRALLSPKKTPAGSKVFVGDMTDLFGSWVPDGLLDQLFAVFALRPDVVFQVLTKRPERMAGYMAGLQAAADAHAPHTVEGRFTPAQVLNFRMFAGSPKIGGVLGVAISPSTPWPLPNVWLGTSCEDQRAADERIPHLLKVPAAVRFLSCEPLIGPVDLRRFLPNLHTGFPRGPRVGWVIVGGESGRDARPMHPDWARSLRDQCQTAGVAFHFKQWGEFAPGDAGGMFSVSDKTSHTIDELGRLDVRNGGGQLLSLRRVGKKNAGRLLDGRTWDEFPASLGHWPSGCVSTPRGDEHEGE